MHILWAILAGWGIAVGGMFLGLVLSALCATIVDEKSGGDAIWVVVLGSLIVAPAALASGAVVGLRIAGVL